MELKIVPALVVVVLIAMGGVMLDQSKKLAGALRANRILSAELVNGDANVEMVVDTRTGDAFIQVNGEHIHVFPAACPPSSAPF